MDTTSEETEEYRKGIKEIGDLVFKRVDKLWENRPSLDELSPAKQLTLKEVSAVAVLSDVTSYIGKILQEKAKDLHNVK